MLDRINRAVNTVRAIWTLIGWFGLSSSAMGLAIAFGGAAWAMITGVSAPIVVIAAFCGLIATAYLALLPLTYRALLRAHELPLQNRPDPEVWRHLPQFRLFEAACLLADVEPSAEIAEKPGSANGFYRAIRIEIDDGRIRRVLTRYDDPQYGANTDTVISREDLQSFANSRGVKRAFLAP